MSSSSTTIEMEDDRRELPSHPGEILREDFLPDFGLDVRRLAQALDLPESLVSLILSAHAPVTPNVALRLGRAFNQTAQFWMNLQVHHDLAVAERAAANDLERVTPIAAA
jgi:addiction module HigA family antidote